MARNYISTVCKGPGTSLSSGRLKWALVAQRTELQAQTAVIQVTNSSPKYSRFLAIKCFDVLLLHRISTEPSVVRDSNLAFESKFCFVFFFHHTWPVPIVILAWGLNHRFPWRRPLPPVRHFLWLIHSWDLEREEKKSCGVENWAENPNETRKKIEWKLLKVWRK